MHLQHVLAQITVPKGVLLFDWSPLGTETIKTKLVESSAQILCTSLNSYNFQNKTPN